MYHDAPDIEYNAIRQAAALIDVSPLYKYLVRGPHATRLVDRVITRDATRIAVGQVAYACWCDEAGAVIDDGTIARLDPTTYRWTAAEPNFRWLRDNAAGLEVEIEDVTDQLAALAVQGPTSRALLEHVTGRPLGDLRYYRRRPAVIADVELDISRTGYTGDLGYELWLPAESAARVWDALSDAAPAFAARPVGLLALDVARLEAGLILIEVDYTSARHALIAEQTYSPDEIGLDRLVDLDGADFVGRRALLRQRAAGGAPRRLVGLVLDWDKLEALFRRHGLPPAMSPTAWRAPVPLYGARRQVGRATSGTWSPTLKRSIALGSVEARFARPGTRLGIEWTVEAQRSVVAAEVVTLPFFDPPRKRAWAERPQASAAE